MKDNYTTFHDVIYYDTAPSGKAIRVKVGSNLVWIPDFAVHEDSELCVHTENSQGTLVIQTSIAEEKGLIEPESSSTRIGIPLKRNRLPDPPKMKNSEELKAIRARLVAATKDCTLASPTEVASPSGGLIALFEGTEAEANAKFFVEAPSALWALLDENALLRAWVEAALKTQQRTKPV